MSILLRVVERFVVKNHDLLDLMSQRWRHAGSFCKAILQLFLFLERMSTSGYVRPSFCLLQHCQTIFSLGILLVFPTHLGIQQDIKSFTIHPTTCPMYALIDLTHTVSMMLEENKYVRCLLIVFSKAADSDVHAILINKLKALNIDDNIISWMVDRLTDCNQFWSTNIWPLFAWWSKVI